MDFWGAVCVWGFLYYGNCFSHSFYSTLLNLAVFPAGKSVVFNSFPSLFTPYLQTFSGKKLKVLNVRIFLACTSSAGGVRLLRGYRCLWPGGKQHLCRHGDVHEGGRACMDGAVSSGTTKSSSSSFLRSGPRTHHSYP